MPSGLKNAPAIFQRLMTSEVLTGFLDKFVLVYIDDIVIYSESYEEHLRHVRLVLERLQQYGLKCALEICKFVKTNLEFLGHELTETGLRPLQKHVNHIVQLEQPRSYPEFRSLLGTINCLREYIPHCAERILPLTALLAGKQKYKWTPEAEKALEDLREVLKQPL